MKFNRSICRTGRLVAALLAIPFLQSKAAVVLPAQIAVGLADHQKEALVESLAAFSVREMTHPDTLFTSRSARFTLSDTGLETDGRPLPNDLVVEAHGSVLKYLGKTYKGLLEIKRAGGGGILVINRIPLEDYLTGVLPFEVPPEWKPETLKAQAIVCRTYVISSLKRHDTSGYDVCATTHCQVYKGASGEDPRTSRAVEETKGEIMTYQGNIVEAYFHDDCGGMTESAEDVWTTGSRLPYLKRVRCPSTIVWKAYVDAGDLARAIPSPKIDASDIKSFKVSSWTPSGRAKMITVSTRRHGKIVIPANTLRLRIGADVIRSTFWKRIERKKSGWDISGKGWGHGVGLCQWGAERLGERGASYKDILKHYFKGVAIEHGSS